jgi:hypothetical protein
MVGRGDGRPPHRGRASELAPCKASLDARAGRPEYRLLNLVDRVLEIRREPAPSPSAPYGWDERGVQVVTAGERVSPPAAPTASIAIDDLLP